MNAGAQAAVRKVLLVRGIVGRTAYPDKGMCESRSSQIRRSSGVRPHGDRCGRGALRSGRSLRHWAHLPCGPRRSERSTANRRVRARARPRASCATPRAEAAAGLAGAGAASSPGRARADDTARSLGGARRPPRAAAASGFRSCFVDGGAGDARRRRVARRFRSCSRPAATAAGRGEPAAATAARLSRAAPARARRQA